MVCKAGGFVTFLAAVAVSASLSAIPIVAQETSSGSNAAQPETPLTSGLRAGVTSLSDSEGVDLSTYLTRLHADVEHNWSPLTSKMTEPPRMKKGTVGIRFAILPDGRIGSMKLETTSGDVELDKAAWYAITSEGQFPPLPKEFHGPQIELRVAFFYNTPIPKGSKDGLGVFVTPKT
jgi:TonB family protein